jgi:hypothetical protein
MWLPVVLALLCLGGGPKVLRDTSLAFHWTPGVWFMLLRVDCDREDGMEAEIIDPSGKVLCPLRVGNPGATMVANRCDCLALSLGPREGSRGWSAVDATAWKPKRGLYGIRVKGLAPCKVMVSGGAAFSRSPHWAPADTMMIGPGEEHFWTAQWGAIKQGDSSRVRLHRAPTVESDMP